MLSVTWKSIGNTATSPVAREIFDVLDVRKAELKDFNTMSLKLVAQTIWATRDKLYWWLQELHASLTLS